MTPGVTIRAGVVSVVLAAVITALSQWPVSMADEGAFVRLSWRTEPIRVEECRRFTDEELAGIPSHMRRAEECTGDFVDYELTLVLDGGTPSVDTLSPSGLRRDRPVYVLHDEAVAAGVHGVEVTFRALVPEGFEVTDRPVTLTWSGEVPLVARQVGLITLDPTGTAFVLR